MKNRTKNKSSKPFGTKPSFKEKPKTRTTYRSRTPCPRVQAPRILTTSAARSRYRYPSSVMTTIWWSKWWDRTRQLMKGQNLKPRSVRLRNSKAATPRRVQPLLTCWLTSRNSSKVAGPQSRTSWTSTRTTERRLVQKLWRTKCPSRPLSNRKSSGSRSPNVSHQLQTSWFQMKMRCPTQ